MDDDEDTVEISIPVTASEAERIEMIWEHRALFGWKTKDEMFHSFIMAGYLTIKAGDN